MYDTPQDDSALPHDTPAPAPLRPPPLRLAGIDEDDTGEPHAVRGID